MLTIFLLILGLRVAGAERPAAPRTGHLEVGGNYSYFTTSGNFDLNGQKVADPNGGGLSTNAVTASAGYDFSGRFRIYGGLTYADTSSTDGFFDRDNGTITEVPLGAQYFGAFGKFLWVAQGDAGVTLYKVSEAADATALADGVNRARAGGWLIYRAGNLQPFVNLGGEYRDGGRSSLIPYVAGAHLKLDKFWIEAQLRGQFALGNDSDSALADRARREAYLRRVNGGSFKYYSVNPTLHEAAVEAGYRFDQFHVFGGAAMAYLGNSSAQGYVLSLGLRFTLATARKTVSTTSYGGPTDEGGFAPKEESYDDTLFNDRPVVRRAAPAPVTPPPRNNAPSVRVVPKRKGKPNRRQERQQQNLDQLLNDTEHGLEGK